MKMTKSKCVALVFCLILVSGLSIALETNKVFVLRFSYDNGNMVMTDKYATAGYAPDRKSADNGYRLDILNRQGGILYSTYYEIPLIEYLDVTNNDTGELTGGVVRYNRLNFSIVVPYFEDAEMISIYNKKNFKIIEDSVNEKNYNGFWAVGVVILIFGIVALFFIKKGKKHI